MASGKWRALYPYYVASKFDRIMGDSDDEHSCTHGRNDIRPDVNKRQFAIEQPELKKSSCGTRMRDRACVCVFLIHKLK
jgi:hypothetical protein